MAIETAAATDPGVNVLPLLEPAPTRGPETGLLTGLVKGATADEEDTPRADRRVSRRGEGGGPAEVLQAFDDGANALGRRPFAATAVEVGERAPGFTLPDALGREVSLGDLVAEGAVVLTFYRGSWCPYCNLQLKAYQEILDALEEAGAGLVAVSPMTPDNSLYFAEKAGLRFTVLSDAGAQVAERYGLVFALDGSYRELHRDSGVDLPALNGDDSWRLPAPATYVIDSEGIVRFAHVDGDYRWRLEPDALLTAVRGIAANSSTDKARARGR